MSPRRPAEILLVEDNPADARLMLEALRDTGVPSRLSVVEDGEQALDFMRRAGRYAGAPRPHLVFLDLNLPGKDGREVLAEIKQDSELKCIPVVVLTTSNAQRDIRDAYDLRADCYVTKPLGLDDFIRAIRLCEAFWLDATQSKV